MQPAFQTTPRIQLIVLPAQVAKRQRVTLRENSTVSINPHLLPDFIASHCSPQTPRKLSEITAASRGAPAGGGDPPDRAVHLDRDVNGNLYARAEAKEKVERSQSL